MGSFWKWALIGGAVLFFSVILLFMIGIMALLVSPDFESLEGNVAVIPIKGEILAEDEWTLGGTTVSSTDTIELIEKAEESGSIKAVIFEINSPGGSGVASQEISDAIRRMNKPSVAWIRDEAASGAYWAASATDHIVASSMSITGSIGVIASYVEYGGVLNKYNASYERLVSGQYKDMGSPLRQMTPAEREKFQALLDGIHEEFVAAVAENRNLDTGYVKSIATGEVFLGKEAVRMGLVDEIGGKQEALNYMESQLNITPEPVSFKKRKTFFDAFSEAASRQSFHVGEGIGSSLMRQQRIQIRT